MSAARKSVSDLVKNFNDSTSSSTLSPATISSRSPLISPRSRNASAPPSPDFVDQQHLAPVAAASNSARPTSPRLNAQSSPNAGASKGSYISDNSPANASETSVNSTESRSSGSDGSKINNETANPKEGTGSKLMIAQSLPSSRMLSHMSYRSPTIPVSISTSTKVGSRKNQSAGSSTQISSQNMDENGSKLSVLASSGNKSTGGSYLQPPSPRIQVISPDTTSSSGVLVKTDSSTELKANVARTPPQTQTVIPSILEKKVPATSSASNSSNNLVNPGNNAAKKTGSASEVLQPKKSTNSNSGSYINTSKPLTEVTKPRSSSSTTDTSNSVQSLCNTSSASTNSDESKKASTTPATKSISVSTTTSREVSEAVISSSTSGSATTGSASTMANGSVGTNTSVKTVAQTSSPITASNKTNISKEELRKTTVVHGPNALKIIKQFSGGPPTIDERKRAGTLSAPKVASASKSGDGADSNTNTSSPPSTQISTSLPSTKTNIASSSHQTDPKEAATGFTNKPVVDKQSPVETNKSVTEKTASEITEKKTLEITEKKTLENTEKKTTKSEVNKENVASDQDKVIIDSASSNHVPGKSNAPKQGYNTVNSSKTTHQFNSASNTNKSSRPELTKATVSTPKFNPVRSPQMQKGTVVGDPYRQTVFAPRGTIDIIENADGLKMDTTETQDSVKSISGTKIEVTVYGSQPHVSASEDYKHNFILTRSTSFEPGSDSLSSLCEQYFAKEVNYCNNLAAFHKRFFTPIREIVENHHPIDNNNEDKDSAVRKIMEEMFAKIDQIYELHVRIGSNRENDLPPSSQLSHAMGLMLLKIGLYEEYFSNFDSIIAKLGEYRKKYAQIESVISLEESNIANESKLQSNGLVFNFKLNDLMLLPFKHFNFIDKIVKAILEKIDENNNDKPSIQILSTRISRSIDTLDKVLHKEQDNSKDSVKDATEKVKDELPELKINDLAENKSQTQSPIDNNRRKVEENYCYPKKDSLSVMEQEFIEFIKDREKSDVFRRFLTDSLCDETIELWDQIEQLKKLIDENSDISVLITTAQEINNTYITVGAQKEVNLDADHKKAVDIFLKSPEHSKEELIAIFLPVQDFVCSLLFQDSWSKFKRSKSYQDINVKKDEIKLVPRSSSSPYENPAQKDSKKRVSRIKTLINFIKEESYLKRPLSNTNVPQAKEAESVLVKNDRSYTEIQSKGLRKSKSFSHGLTEDDVRKFQEEEQELLSKSETLDPVAADSANIPRMRKNPTFSNIKDHKGRNRGKSLNSPYSSNVTKTEKDPKAKDSKETKDKEKEQKKEKEKVEKPKETKEMEVEKDKKGQDKEKEKKGGKSEEANMKRRKTSIPEVESLEKKSKKEKREKEIKEEKKDSEGKTKEEEKSPKEMRSTSDGEPSETSRKERKLTRKKSADNKYANKLEGSQ